VQNGPAGIEIVKKCYSLSLPIILISLAVMNTWANFPHWLWVQAFKILNHNIQCTGHENLIVEGHDLFSNQKTVSSWSNERELW
jgi:hypothetical protein